MSKRMRLTKRWVVCVMPLLLSGCIGTIIGVTTDAAIGIAKIPFKVGHAIVDSAVGDDDDEAAHAKKSETRTPEPPDKVEEDERKEPAAPTAEPVPHST